jgi:hypothetical protein
MCNGIVVDLSVCSCYGTRKVIIITKLCHRALFRVGSVQLEYSASELYKRYMASGVSCRNAYMYVSVASTHIGQFMLLDVIFQKKRKKNLGDMYEK